uniref:Uncharacterized protein n=1 Tax=Anguilla anguilla TaxID=7936 RepID=A0A0E9VLK9_ANGAN
MLVMVRISIAGVNRSAFSIQYYCRTSLRKSSYWQNNLTLRVTICKLCLNWLFALYLYFIIL